MDAKNDILLTILARTDALFMPLRGNCFKRTAAWERRKLFADCGIDWPEQDRTPSGRQAARREAADLKASGDIEVLGAGGSNLRCKLTSEADDGLRQAIGLNNYAGSLLWVDELWRLRDSPDGFDDADLSWTSEAALTGTPWGCDDLRWKYVELSESLMPALHRGLIESGCSSQGHCWYGLSGEGLTLAQMRAENGLATESPVLPDLLRNDERLYPLYSAERREEVTRLAKLKPLDPREISPMPLPVHPPLRRLTN